MTNNYSNIPNYSGDGYSFSQEDYLYTELYGTFDPSYQPQQLYYPYSQTLQHNYTPESQYGGVENNPGINNSSNFIPVYEPSDNLEYSFPLNYENHRESMSSQESCSPFSQQSTNSSNYSFEMSPDYSGEAKTFEFKKESKG